MTEKPGTRYLAPCGRCVTWVEITGGPDNVFMLQTTHEIPENCSFYRMVQEEMTRQGKPQIIVDARPGRAS